MALTTLQVQQLYLGYYGRPADPVGLTYWQTQTLDVAMAGFAASAEFTNQYAGMTVEQQVAQVYVNLLGREADVNGLLYWANEIVAGRETIGTLVMSIQENALGRDVTTLEMRTAFSADFTAALDTTPEVLAYSGQAAAVAARDAMADIVAASTGDTSTLITALANLDTIVAAVTAGGGMDGQTFVLTAGVDNIVGTVGNDTIQGFVGNDGNWDNNLSTLNTFDTIDGGAGIDTLDLLVNYDYTVDAKMSNVEVISARMVGSTTASIDFANISGVTTVEIKDTNADWGSINGWNVADAISTYKFTNVARQTNSVSVTLEFNNDVFTGSADAINVVLDNAGNTTNNYDANLSLDNANNESVIEELNIQSLGSDNQFVYSENGWTPSVLETVNVSGTAALNLSIDTQDALATVNAAAFDGGLTFDGFSGVDMAITTGAGKDIISVSANDNTITTGAGNDDITIGLGKDTVNAGAGDDIVRTGANLTIDDLLDGGDGVDTLGIASATAVTASSGVGVTASVSNFEVLAIDGALGGNINLAKLGAMQSLKLGGGAGAAIVTGLATGATIESNAAHTGNLTVTMTGAATGTADVLNLKLNAAGSADFWAINAADVETVNINSTTSATDPTTVTNLLDLLADAHTTVNVTGDALLNLAGVALTSVETVAGADFNAGLAVSLVGNGNDTTVTLGNGDNNVTGGDGADTITTGSGDDIINAGAGNDTINAGAGDDTISGGAGNDTIDAGAGDDTITGGLGLDTLTGGAGVDTFVYTAAAESQGVTVDVITDFTVGATGDIIDLSGVNAAGVFAGIASGYGAVLTTLAFGTAKAVLDSSTGTLYFDANADGALDTADMAIQLTGVTTGLVAANFDFTV